MAKEIPIKGIKVLPKYCDNDIMLQAWVDFIRWASTNRDITHMFFKTISPELKEILNKEYEDPEQNKEGWRITAEFSDWATKNLWNDMKEVKVKSLFSLDLKKKFNEML
jgi:hypothetical protein